MQLEDIVPAALNFALHVPQDTGVRLGLRFLFSAQLGHIHRVQLGHVQTAMQDSFAELGLLLHGHWAMSVQWVDIVLLGRRQSLSAVQENMDTALGLAPLPKAVSPVQVSVIYISSRNNRYSSDNF